MAINAWNFKLKKTRIILIASIVWCFLSYQLATGILMLYTNPDHYYHILKLTGCDWDWMGGQFIAFTSPVWIYWIVIPFLRIVVNWIKTGE